MTGAPARRGRPSAAPAGEVARTGLQLFLREGYQVATMADVARAAGIGRSTLFRYFPSKASLVWHGTDEVVAAIGAALGGAPPDRPWRAALVAAVVEGFGFSDGDLVALRWRLQLITADPDLRAHLLETMEPVVDAVARFVAARTGAAPADLVPQVTARATLVAGTTALAWWAADGAAARGSAVDGPQVALRDALQAVLLGP